MIKTLSNFKKEEYICNFMPSVKERFLFLWRRETIRVDIMQIYAFFCAWIYIFFEFELLSVKMSKLIRYQSVNRLETFKDVILLPNIFAFYVELNKTACHLLLDIDCFNIKA